MAQRLSSGDKPLLQAVSDFGDNVIRRGTDLYGSEHTPLLVDGINVRTHEPVKWRWTGSRTEFGPPGEWIISNLAQQQNLFRTFVGLSNLTGDPTYRQVAEEAIRYHYHRYQSPCGLMRWGGHQFVDLETKEPQGKAVHGPHEFKITYPFYQLMWDVDSERAKRCIEAVWNAHVLDWDRLDVSRHGQWGKPMGRLWDNSFSDPAPFFEGKGLTFINCGSDLVYAAAYLSHLTGEESPLIWSKRLAHLYVKARHPKTLLGAYQYSQPLREHEPPPGGSTNSKYGDRAKAQLGPEFGEIALEGNVLLPRHAHVIYGNAAIVQMQMGEVLGNRGNEFVGWVRDGLVAYAKYAYNPATNLVKPMLTDGTDLTGFALKRSGYYGKKGEVLQPSPADFLLFWSYALGFRLTNDPTLWETARTIGRSYGLGDLGEAPGENVRVNLTTKLSDPLALVGLLEIMKDTPDRAYVELARTLGANIVGDRFHFGFFLPSDKHVYAKFDTVEPLALLLLEAHLQGKSDAVPAYNAGMGYLHGMVDDRTRTTDNEHIYGRTL